MSAVSTTSPNLMGVTNDSTTVKTTYLLTSQHTELYIMCVRDHFEAYFKISETNPHAHFRVHNLKL